MVTLLIQDSYLGSSIIIELHIRNIGILCELSELPVDVVRVHNYTLKNISIACGHDTRQSVLLVYNAYQRKAQYCVDTIQCMYCKYHITRHICLSNRWVEPLSHRSSTAFYHWVEPLSHRSSTAFYRKM